MSEQEIQSLEDLGGAIGQGEENAAPVYVQKIDAQGRAYATGKRKNAIARVWIKPGKGVITVNGREFEKYFARPVLRMVLQQPLVAANRDKQYDIVCTVTGGGLSGQAGADRNGVAKALTHHDQALRSALNEGRLLTRYSSLELRKKSGTPQHDRQIHFSNL